MSPIDSAVGIVNRTAMIARWYELTRIILPAMAPGQRWPVRLDHCFMRICLDAALGSPWTKSVARPAVANMSLAQLAAAIRAAEVIVSDPGQLPALNARSLAGRRSAQPRRVHPGPSRLSDAPWA